MNVPAWARWQTAAGPWRGWAICPALTMPVTPGTTVPATTPAALDLTEVLQPANTAVLLDIHPLLGIRTAAEVSRQGMAYVVLVLPRWPHTGAVLPVFDLAAALVDASRYVRGEVPTTNVVFVLDGERQQRLRRPKADARVDNRYALTSGDLPNLAVLRRAGITRLVKVASTG
ncbi:MAG: hypothetical protein JOZ65_15475 [Chloroflexi bacterium]|nr:hypothetical protein [Chloroflexota bacterium]